MHNLSKFKRIFKVGKLLKESFPLKFGKIYGDGALKTNLFSNRVPIRNFTDKTKNIQARLFEIVRKSEGSALGQEGDAKSKTILSEIVVHDDKNASVQLHLTKDYRKVKALIEKEIKEDLDLSNISIKVAIAQPKPQKQASPKPQDQQNLLTKVKHIIAVSSCKGGVGKSTVAVNLAFSLNKLGYKTGIFDADIHGPSIPTMLNTTQKVALTYEDDKRTIIPLDYKGLRTMSYGFAAPNKRAVVRGPIVSGIVTSLLKNTNWEDLDFLVIDFPPGTGDIQLTLLQEAKISGGIIVTTPQRLSFIDVVKGIEMFDELKVPILGVVENMAYFTCDSCSKKHMIFGNGYENMLRKQFGIEDAFKFPLDDRLSRTGDAGEPYVSLEGLEPGDQVNQEFTNMALTVVRNVVKLSNSGSKVPIVDYDRGVFTVVENLAGENSRTKRIDAYELRTKCLCAACVDEFTGESRILKSSIPQDVHPLRIEPKGNYAVAVVWSDGHRSSIYPYKRIFSEDIKSL